MEEVLDRDGNGIERLDSPVDLAVDPAGNAYVTALGSRNAFRIGADGSVVVLGRDGVVEAGGASAVAVDAFGRPYFIVPESGRIVPPGDDPRAPRLVDLAPLRLDSPSDLAFDRAGNLIVTGQGSHNVLRFAGDGTVEEIAGASGDDRGAWLLAPDALAVDPEGNVWVAARASDVVLRVAPDGSISKVLGPEGDGVHPLVEPSAIAVDREGNAWVAGAGSHNVFRLAADGIVTQVLDAGAKRGGPLLLEPADLAVDGAGFLWVAGSGSHNVLRLSPDGAVLEAVGPAGDGDGGALLAPSAIAIDPAGHVFVAGRDSDNVLRIRPREGDESCDGIDDDCDGAIDEDCGAPDADLPWIVAPEARDEAVRERPVEGTARATREERLGTPCTPVVAVTRVASAAGDGVTPLHLPRIKGLDPSGNLWVASEGADDLFRISPAGVVTRMLSSAGDGVHAFAGLDPVDGFAVDPGTGDVFVAGTISDNVFRITPAGVVTRVLSAAGDGVHALSAPVHIAARGGSLYVAGSASDNLFRVTAGGAVSQLLGPAGVAGNPLDDPGWVGTDASGNVYVAGIASGNVFRITPGGAVSEIVDAAGDGAHPLQGLAPGGFAVSESGTVWAAGQASVNVLRVSPGGAIAQVLDAAGDGSHALGMPGSLVVDAAGNLFVFDELDAFFNAAVFRVAPAGAVARIIGPEGDGANSLVSGFQGVADADGNFYVGGFDSVDVFRIAPSGVVSQVVDGSGDGTHALSGPVPRLAVDSAGNVYVAGHSSDNVFRVTVASDSSCDGVDDDCDGTSDEAFQSASTLCGRGTCADNTGELTCQAGQLFDSCDPFAGAAADDPTCDGIDEDCDGAIDEEHPVVPTSCGAGPCFGEGAAVCINGELVDTCYPLDGSVEKLVGAAGDGTTPLQFPRIKGIDPAGNLWVASHGADDLFRVTPAGVVTRRLSAAGDGVHPFAGLDPLDGFAIDPASGDVYAAGTESDTVFRITPAGAVTLVADGANGVDAPLHLAVSGGALYVAGRLSDNVLRVAPGGEVSEIIGPAGDGSSPLDEPGWLGADAAGNVYVAALASGNVFRIDSGGSVVEILGPAGDGTHPLDGLAPGGFALDPLGVLFVAGQDSVNVFRVEGTFVSVVLDAAGDGVHPLGRPGALELDRFGNLYVFDDLDAFFDSAVFRVSPGGAAALVLDASGDGVHPLHSGFAGVADPVGNFYVGGFDSQNVFRIGPTGEVVQVLGASGDGATPLSRPVPRMALDAAGNLFVAGSESHAVFRVPPGRAADEDGDGIGECAGDCDESDPTVYPDAPEVNDGQDNQCPGDAGHGSVDEISGSFGFTSPGNKSRLSWPAQAGATQYELARSTSPKFAGFCSTIVTPNPVIIDPQLPSPNSGFFYLVRALAPHAGSWGTSSAGVERVVSCP